MGSCQSREVEQEKGGHEHLSRIERTTVLWLYSLRSRADKGGCRTHGEKNAKQAGGYLFLHIGKPKTSRDL